MTISARALCLFGTDEPPPPRLLNADPLSAELEDGQLRHLRFHGVEVLRGIAFLVRDPHWATLHPEITSLETDESSGLFRVTWSGIARQGSQELSLSAEISGDTSGIVMFRGRARAITDFDTCRTGFVVLHPANVAGLDVEIELADGGKRAGRFPYLIDPIQPMSNLRALTHAPLPGWSVCCRMDGDVFEMEDQRNWTDASFKTYVRPLCRPWPYTLPAGSVVEQSVALNVRGSPRTSSDPNDGLVRLEITEASAVMPPIGLGCTPDEAVLGLQIADRIKAAGVSCLVCRYDPAISHGADVLSRYRDLAAAIGATVDLQLVVHSVEGFAHELALAASVIRMCGLPLASLSVSPVSDLKNVTPGQVWPPSAPLDALYRAARAIFPGVPLGGGMFSYFTELNRKRPPVEHIDFVSFSTSPLVHAADDRSVMQSLEAIPPISDSVRAFSGGKPFVVCPSTIGMRDNPYGPHPLDNPHNVRQAMSGADPRQGALFNAAWTFGYIAAFAFGGAARIAVSAPAGPYGIADAMAVWPVFHIVRACAGLRGATLRHIIPSATGTVASFVVDGENGTELWVANLTASTIRASVPAPFSRGFKRTLDADCKSDALADPMWFERNSTAHHGMTVILSGFATVVLRPS
jgi:hypothetical protein